MDMNNVANYVQIADFFIPVFLGVLAFAGRRWLKNELETMGLRVDERTGPIQRDANGGRSLPDVAKRLESIDRKVDGLHMSINDVGRDVAHLTGRFEQHIEETR